MQIKNTDAGILTVPGAKIAKDHPMYRMPMAEKIKRVESGKAIAQAMFKNLQPFALTNSEHPAFAKM